MTCASCKYQWCWLCEGQYKYGHYDSGKCNGHQFTKADSLEEANKKKKVKKVNNPPQVIRPFDSDDSYIDYLFILGFWFFGTSVVFIWVVMENLTTKVNKFTSAAELPTIVMTFLMGITMFVCFQISFFCLITPFMIASLIYYPFFYKFIFFFGLGEK